MPRRSGIGTGDYQIAELSVGLELDLEELNLDAAVADKTVSEMITKLNHRAKQLEIRAEIDLTNLENAGTEVDRLHAKEARLNEILDVQRRKLQLLKEQYEKASGDKNVGDGIKGRLSNGVLLQELEVSKVESALRGLSSEAGAALPAFETVGAAAGLAVIAIGEAAMKAAELAQYAAASGQALGRFAEDLGTTAQEARGLQIALSLGGAGSDAFTKFITNLDKRFQSTGRAGEETREQLRRFGVSLGDGEGRLAGYAEQLERLAEGYRTAKDAGMANEFMAALGPGADALRDVLDNYGQIEGVKARMGSLFDAKSTEEFVAQSKMLDDRMKELNLSIEQIKVSLGAAFLPFITDIAPGVAEAVRSVTESVIGMSETVRKRYKNLRYQFGYTREEYEAAIKEEAEKKARDAAEAERKKAEARAKVRERELESYKEKLTEFNGKIQESIDAGLRTDIGNKLAAIDRQAEQQKRELEKLAKEYHATPDGDSLALIEKNAEMQKEKAIRAFSEQTAAYLEGIYETELDARLRQIEREKQAWIQKGLDEARATEAAEEQKRRAVNSSVIDLLSKNKKYLDLYRKIMGGQTGGFRGGQMMFDNGSTPEERMSLVREEFRKQMLMDAKIDPGARISAAELRDVQQLMKEVRDTMGLSLLDGDYTGLANLGDDIAGSISQSIPQMAEAMSQAMANAAPSMARPVAEAMQSALSPLTTGDMSLGFSGMTDTMAAVRDALERLNAVLETLGETSRPPVESNITVDIGAAVTPDSEAMTWLADTVADRITPVVEQAIGRETNGY